jgi:glycosyltransferase involved in cell wall biosynthesis
MYKLSIITINKNNSIGLEKTIQSVINQTYFDKIEYIIIDGLSTDSSSFIIDKYKDYFSYWISEEDNGIYDAMNKGTNAAIGKYLLFLNSGDVLYHNKIIEEIYSELNTYDIVYGGVEYEGEKHIIRIPPEKLDYIYFSKRRSVFHQGAFISKKLLLELPYDTSYKLMGDVNFFFNAICIKKATYKRILKKIAIFDINGISSREVYAKEKEKTKILLNGLKYIEDENIKQNFLKNIKVYNRLINQLPIDFVFPYVDNSDPNWIQQYMNCCTRRRMRFNTEDVRYRDYGTLKYLLRGIDKCLPWIRNIYIIVEQESQVPNWLNRDNVKIVYHKDIIPEDFLPTYNSGTIEMYLKNIPELSEYFIYGNDDMFPISLMDKSNFFDEDGLPILSMQKYQMEDNWRPNTYQSMLLNSNFIAYNDLNLIREDNTIIKWNHTITPMRKSTWEGLFNRHREEIEKSCSTFRSPKNITQELVNSWHYLSGQYNKDYTLKVNYISIQDIKNEDILYESIKDYQVICINDGNINKEILPFEKIKSIILNTFEKLFPEKSKYEL